MGGKGSGGARIGAGRKSKSQAQAALHGSRDRRTQAARPSTPATPVTMPRGLSADERAVWKACSRHALESLTLTPATAGAFADFCRAVALRDQLRKRLDDDGWTYLKDAEPKKHPLFSEYRAWQQRVEAAQARFRLTAFGKEIVSAEPAVDPFDEFDGPKLVKGASA